MSMPISVNDTLIQCAAAYRTINDRVYSAVFEDAVDALRQAAINGRTVWLFGVGKPGYVAQRAASTWGSIGIPATYIHPTEALHGELNRTRAEDVTIFISQSGESDEVVACAQWCKQTERIVITGGTTSRLWQLADIVLDTSGPVETVPIVSVAMQNAWIDALTVGFISRLHIAEDMFLNGHPGGAIGRRRRGVAMVEVDA